MGLSVLFWSFSTLGDVTIQSKQGNVTIWKKTNFTHLGRCYPFVIDYDRCDKIPFANTIQQEWAKRINMKESMAKNRYEAGYINEYKKWLQDNLCGVVKPTPHVGRGIEDVKVRLQIKIYHFQ